MMAKRPALEAFGGVFFRQFDPNAVHMNHAKVRQPRNNISRWTVEPGRQ